MTKRTDACVCSALRCSHFITFRMFSITRPKAGLFVRAFPAAMSEPAAASADDPCRRGDQ